MKKNQKPLIIVVAAVALVGISAFFFLQNKSGTSEQANVITSIKDALSQSVSMECTYTDEEGRQSKAYIKNGAIRSDYTGADEEESGSMIVTEKKMYMWSGKEGYMMDIPEVTPTEEEQTVSESIAQKDEVVADLEKYKESCKPAVLLDSLFTPPADVNFQDYSQMMEQNMQMMQEQSGMSEEQMQQYMEQYSSPQ